MGATMHTASIVVLVSLALSVTSCRRLRDAPPRAAVATHPAGSRGGWQTATCAVPRGATHTVVVCADRAVLPADGRLVGFVHGVTYSPTRDYAATDALIDGLRPYTWRLAGYGEVARYVARGRFVERFGTRVVVNVQDLFNQVYGRPITVSTRCAEGARGCFTSFDALRATWGAFLPRALDRVAAAGIAVAYYDLLSEPELGAFLDASGRTIPGSQLGALFVDAFRAVKRRQPDARIVGPSTAIWSPAMLRAVVDIAATQGLSLDALSWHELGAPQGNEVSVMPEEVPAHVEATRAIVREGMHCGERCPEVHINEYQLERDYYVPGQAAGWLFYLSMAKVDLASRACWDAPDSCFRSFNGLLDASDRRPTNLYHVYRSYAEMTGHLVEAASTDTRDVALAAFDAPGARLRILAGRYGHDGDVVDITLRVHVPALAGRVLRVRTWAIANDGGRPSILDAPFALGDDEVRVASGELVLPLRRFVDGDVRVIDVQPR